jgi:pimeloyl-ACP methyl ester carboxylesterase
MFSSRGELQHRFIVIDGIRTHYLVVGDGPPVVLLHGNGESVADWSRTLPHPASGIRVYAIDLPGAGDSDKPPLDYSAEGLADFVIHFLDALVIDRPALVGHSFGGLIALMIALRQPERVAALTLIDSAGLGKEIHPMLAAASLPVAGELSTAWAATWLGAKQRAWTRGDLHFARTSQIPHAWLSEQERMAQMPGYLEAELAAARQQTVIGQQRVVVLDRLPHVKCPVMIVWGERDRAIPVHHATAAAQRIPNSRIAIIPKAGHLPHVERPGETGEAMHSCWRSSLGLAG